MRIPIEYNQAFLTYLSVQGDLEKTAASLMCDEEELRTIATQHEWAGRYAKLQKIRADKGQEAMAKELNRTVNYVQAVQMRQLIDRVIIEFGDDTRLMNALTIPTKGGGSMFTTKPLEGLAKALETAQKMTYMALGDMITEREAIEERNAGSAALGVLRMMASRTGLIPERDEIMPAKSLAKHLDRAEAAIPAAPPSPTLAQQLDQDSPPAPVPLPKAKANHEPIHKGSRDARILETLDEEFGQDAQVLDAHQKRPANGYPRGAAGPRVGARKAQGGPAAPKRRAPVGIPTRPTPANPGGGGALPSTLPEGAAGRSSVVSS